MAPGMPTIIHPSSAGITSDMSAGQAPILWRTTLLMPGASLSPVDPPNLSGFVATKVSPVFGEFRCSSLRDINLPVSADLSEVLLLFGLLVLPPRNLSSPIPRPGNAPAAPM